MSVTGISGYSSSQIGTSSPDTTKVQSPSGTTESNIAETTAVAEQDTVVLSEEAMRLSALGGNGDWPDPPTKEK